MQIYIKNIIKHWMKINFHHVFMVQLLFFPDDLTILLEKKMENTAYVATKRRHLTEKIFFYIILLQDIISLHRLLITKYIIIIFT